jgi:hypothetical protein
MADVAWLQSTGIRDEPVLKRCRFIMVSGSAVPKQGSWMILTLSVQYRYRPLRALGLDQEQRFDD